MKGLTEEVQTAARTRLDIAYSKRSEMTRPPAQIDVVAIRRAAVEIQRDRVKRLIESQERSCVWIEEQAGEILKAAGNPVPARWINSAMFANRLLNEDEARTIGLVTDRDASELAQHARVIPWVMEWRKRSARFKPIDTVAPSTDKEATSKSGRPPPVVSVRVMGEQYKVQIRAKLSDAAAQRLTGLLVGLECQIRIGSEDAKTTLRIDALIGHAKLGQIMTMLFPNPAKTPGLGRQLLGALGAVSRK